MTNVSNTNISFSGTYTPTSEGTKTVTLEGTITDENGDTIRNFGSKTITITAENNNTTQPEETPSSGSSEQPKVEDKETKSSNANLKDLGIVTYDFKGFTPSNTSYNATVPADVTSVSVYAKTQATGAKYSVSGNTNLQVGTNKITVTVTAPDGKTKKTYNIFVARQANDEGTEVIPNVIEENPEEKEEEQNDKLGLISIAIDEEYNLYLEPEFKTDIYEYKINIKEDIDKIPFTAIPNRENAKVEITGNENLQNGENIITITVTDETKNEKVEYKIIANIGTITETQEAQETQAVSAEVIDVNNNDTDNKNFILIFAIIALILLIAAPITIYKLKHKKAYYEDSEEDIEEKIEKDDIDKETLDDEPKLKIQRKKSKGKHF